MILLPDEYIELVRQSVDEEGDKKMNTAEKLWRGWEEYGEIITMNHAEEFDLDKPNEGKARGWMIESLAGSIATVSPNTLYNRMRVGRNWIARGLYEKHPVISYSVCMLLMRNLKKKDGLVPEEELQARVEWYYDNNFPTTRTIEDYIKGNGHKKEWEIVAKQLYNKAKKLKETDAPNTWRAAISSVIKAGEAEGWN